VISDRYFFRVLAGLEALCLGCLLLVPICRASRAFWPFCCVLLIGIGISVVYAQLRAKWTFGWLGRPGIIRKSFRFVCTTPLLVFILAIVVDGIFRNEQPYNDAVRVAQASDLVRKEIGEPLKFGWPIQGKSRLSGKLGDTMLLIPVSGNRGGATIRVVAKKESGTWTTTELTLTPVNGAGAKILTLATSQ